MSIVVTDKHFREWEQDAFGYGYGTGEVFILPVLHVFLLHLEHEHSYTAETVAAVLGGPITWFLINVLCRTHIVDYGVSPRYGFLTPQGERLREYVLSKTPEELYEIATQDMDPEAPLCSSRFCNCVDGTDYAGCRYNPLFNEQVPVGVGD